MIFCLILLALFYVKNFLYLFFICNFGFENADVINYIWNRRYYKDCEITKQTSDLKLLRFADSTSQQRIHLRCQLIQSKKALLWPLR